ncbi:MAG: zinc ribbon domain-containing protein [Candidatus Acidiferrales bacterium]
MQPLLEHLIALQRVDLQLAGVRSRLAKLPAQFAEIDSRVNSARAEIERAKASKTAALKDRKKFELDVEQWKEKARKYRDQSYEVKTNEAFKALQHEIQTAESEMARAEDRLLEQMVAGEEYDRQIKAAEKSLAEVESGARIERERLESEKQSASQDLAALELERQKHAAEIPENVLSHYVRIARRHNGVALAEIRFETCSACGLRIRPHVFQEIRSRQSGDLIHCEVCTRILYFYETPAAPSPIADSTPVESHES